jgi:hypothetical protein
MAMGGNALTFLSLRQLYLDTALGYDELLSFNGIVKKFQWFRWWSGYVFAVFIKPSLVTGTVKFSLLRFIANVTLHMGAHTFQGMFGPIRLSIEKPELPSPRKRLYGVDRYVNEVFRVQNNKVRFFPEGRKGELEKRIATA